MIFCKDCGYEGVYSGRFCPRCGVLLSFSSDVLVQMEEARRQALLQGDMPAALEYAHILADAKSPAAMATYGRMLYEAGGESADAAMPYLRAAAEGGDAAGAYTYGRALKERGEDDAHFFVVYAALLGYAEAYAAAAAVFFEQGRREEGIAYLSLAAMGGDTAAALSLAHRYEKGDGTQKDKALAKWYLSFVRPLPLYAWPLSLRLRRISAAKPTAPIAPNITALVSEMLSEAERRGYKKIYLCLCQMLATRGNQDAQCRLGILYAQGYFDERAPEKAKEVLRHYGKKGNAAAYLALGDMYCTGKDMPLSRADAIACYQDAKALGSSEACVRLGDLYAESEGDAPNIAYAYSLYKEALVLGSREGAEKAHEIEEKREALFSQGMAALSSDAEDAYRNFALSASMGYLPAAVALGSCYEEGIGARKDRRRAFLWYENAAKQKDAVAEYRLGRCYFLGIGVNRDFKEAHRLLRHSASLGVDEARAELFSMLEARKKKQLRSLYSLGVRLFYLGKQDAAKDLIERAASLGVARATYVLGCFYEFGIGTEVDRDYAYGLYRTAALQGFSDARARIKSVLLKMLYKKSKGEATVAPKQTASASL